MSSLLNRHALPRIRRLLDVFPVVVITGARQVGKSTLAQMLVEEFDGVYDTLDDETTLTAAMTDAQGFLARTDSLQVVDEVQLLPQLLRAVKLSVDRDRRPGRFILTSSANLLRMRSVTESLAGRAAWFELGPLTWSEIVGAPAPTSIDAMFSARSADDFLRSLPMDPGMPAPFARDRVIAGGMPAALEMNAEDRRLWYDGYRTGFIERDLRQLSRIEHLPEFSRVMSLAMLRTGSLLNRHDLAKDADVAYQTVRRYLGVLEIGYQLWESPPYFASIGKRLTKSPKLYASDTALAAHVANIRSWDDANSMGRSGALMETWVANELRALSELSDSRSTVCFWRTSGGAEVDILFERGDSVIAIEVKSTSQVTARDLRGLKGLREDLGKRFRLGVVATLDDRVQALDASLCAVPIATLLGATGT
jgi:predicted AAA+ superfamily ATPase